MASAAVRSRVGSFVNGSLFISAHIVCECFVFGSCVVVQYLVYYRVLQSYRGGRWSWALYFCHADVSVL